MAGTCFGVSAVLRGAARWTPFRFPPEHESIGVAPVLLDPQRKMHPEAYLPGVAKPRQRS
jgi:hypothetical protein